MVKLITGGKGTGKTTKMIEMANHLVDMEHGNVVFLDKDKKAMYALKHEVRFISLDEYPIEDIKGFIGFLCGVISRDHDIETFFIDGLLKVKNVERVDLQDFVTELEKLSERFEIKFVLSVSCELNQLPDALRKYDRV
ncbi:twitching motility protein PilT [Marinisporobacter balticus]|uniref:Twitching motility protein PilT n=1 Tax=Marinisporobacter balticus TaxID=2018667 RepID=A0A4R2KPH4_9FIRM|nr:twitching motility protein PilT [Marinisporobacter balticus]TCO74527.1 hypothetical protein EV214_1122 [Marinisporobacter balticus]